MVNNRPEGKKGTQESWKSVRIRSSVHYEMAILARIYGERISEFLEIAVLARIAQLKEEKRPGQHAHSK